MTGGTIGRPVLLAALGMLAYAAWLLSQQQQEPETGQGEGEGAGAGGGLLADAGEVLAGAGETAAQAVDSWTGGMLRLSAMSAVGRADLQNKNVQAMLKLIRTTEGTDGPDAYRTMFGGGKFDSYADHPRIVNKRWGKESSAAGAYQILSWVWDESQKFLNLPDFSPASQDIWAVGRIAARGALPDVKAGNIEAALRKLNREWTSFPGGKESRVSFEKALRIFADAGGTVGNMA